MFLYYTTFTKTAIPFSYLPSTLLLMHLYKGTNILEIHNNTQPLMKISRYAYINFLQSKLNTRYAHKYWSTTHLETVQP